MIKQLSVFIAILFLVACQSIPPTPIVPWSEHKKQLISLTNWQAEGKIAVKHPDESFSANFVWRFQNSKTTLRLTNVLGSTLLLIEPERKGYRLHIKDKSYWGPSISNLVSRFSDIPMPIMEMHNWIKGLPSSEQDELTLDGNQLPALISVYPGKTVVDPLTTSNNVYRISYQSYAQQMRQDRVIAMPSALTIDYKETKIRMRINSWSLQN